MTPENFVYWLQGYLEISLDGSQKKNLPFENRLPELNHDQVICIWQHLNEVLINVTRPEGDKSWPHMVQGTC